ncbi:oxidoreductase [Alicyclobacillus cellulosilyticus]|uniref:Oxidoreductase n=1 Tax=Alicyclobacillus cellulosilyticus TaxID=1003997 RepID=A0A917K5U2_9BACL|nr:Gfo/Idh/MocA family oxidoreductase [Alicyclobacillus cellulosilyticus]GGI99010.1 oxidoreductase [Alicyclobacillus cellulosilyticus]
MQRLRVGVVGLGEVAQVIHLPILSALTDMYEVTAVCDISPSLVAYMAERYQVPERYLDLHELVRSPNVDAVFVLNSDEYHAETAIAALEAGKHVFVEKPMCLTLADARAMQAARDRAGRQVMVGYMRRYAPAFIAAKEHLPQLGDIRYARVRDIIGPNRFFIDQSSVVFRPADIPEDALVDRARRADAMAVAAFGARLPAEVYRTYRQLCGLSSHDLSAMRELLGTPRRVVAARAWQHGTYIVALFAYDGFYVTFETGVDEQGRFDAHIEVYGARRSLRVQYNTPYIRHLPTTLHLADTDGTTYRETVVRPTFEDPYTCELKAFYRCITEGHPVKTSIEDSIADLELFQEIIAAVRV